MTTETPERIFPSMGAEAGYDVDDIAPMRVSGYVCLVLALLSPAALVGPAALLIPLAALLFGLFAIRKYGEPVPAGLAPARVGLVLAAGFGACGLFIPVLKSATLGGQAEKFARDYIELVARDEVELAMELRKDYVNRFSEDMPLTSHYEETEGSEDGIIAFRGSSVNEIIRERGPNAAWRLNRAVRVFTHYGQQQAEMIFVDPEGKYPVRLYVVLEYRLDHSNGDGQWHVLRIDEYAEAIYAPQIL